MKQANGVAVNEGRSTRRIVVKDEPSRPRTGDIEVPRIQTQRVHISVEGLSELIVNNFSTKQRGDMQDKQAGKVTARGRGARPIRVPEEEYQAARILDAKKRDCVLARWIKAGLVTAAGLTDKMIPKNYVASTVYVEGDLLPIEGDAPHMRTDMVRVGKWPNKQPDFRYRPAYSHWGLSFTIHYEPLIISEERLFYLVRRMGLNVGLCEWRPEKRGEFGRFDLRTAQGKAS